jgi:ABC-type transporter lipoprotein component MlaA
VVRRGVNKRYSDMGDIMALFVVLDGKKISLPTFTATNFRQIPTVPAIQSHLPLSAINDAVGKFGASVKDLQQQMDSVLSKLDNLKVEQVSAYPVVVDAPALSSNPAAVP